MAPLTRLWTLALECWNLLTFNSFSDSGSQYPIGGFGRFGPSQNRIQIQQPPRFTPPGSNIDGFQCSYPKMQGWKDCHTEDQTCWLQEVNGPGRLDVATDYENDGPIGIDRYYTLVVSDGIINADGMDFNEAKLINGSFPGPLLEACWGDRLHITVINNMTMNGTSIHWHGIRQLNNTAMDGVNGITQCPIPPGSNFTYVWNATQYGSSWLHSHYSVQYADGVQAPITLHGPASMNYTASISPLIMTDWAHNSAFDQLFNPAYAPDFLLNGTGDITRYNATAFKNTTTIPPIYTMNFSSSATTGGGPQKYLIRLINTAFDTGFIFTIDDHELWIVEADFVPVKPFKVQSILVAIGQRYMAVVEASPVKVAKDGNYWIRTYAADGCQGFDYNAAPGYETAGILRYPDQSGSTDGIPTTQPWPINKTCVEHNNLLVPVWPWTVGDPSNGLPDGESFGVRSGLQTDFVKPYATAFFSLQRPNSKPTTPFDTDYGNPMFLQLDSQNHAWPVGSLVVPENYTAEDWAYIVLEGDIGPANQVTGPHPIHLHGHDFTILQTSYELYNSSTLNFTKNNPPRRDVVYVPNNGFVVIAFKTDNPGNWLIHCHIAAHASAGLAMQILERQTDANNLFPHATSPDIKAAQELCSAWNTWAYDCRNFWPGLVDGVYPACVNTKELSVDSGI